MVKTFAKRKKTIAALMSASMFATMFGWGGCNITIDEQLLQDVLGWVDELDLGGFPPPGPCQDCEPFGPRHGDDFDDEPDVEAPQ